MRKHKDWMQGKRHDFQNRPGRVAFLATKTEFRLADKSFPPPEFLQTYFQIGKPLRHEVAETPSWHHETVMIKLETCKQCGQEVALTYEPSIEGNFVHFDKSYAPDGMEYGHLQNCGQYLEAPWLWRIGLLDSERSHIQQETWN